MLDKAAVVYQAVLTKVDKTSPPTCRLRRRDRRRTEDPCGGAPEILVTSAESGVGIAELRAFFFFFFFWPSARRRLSSRSNSFPL